MNNTKTLLITTILALALLANITVGSVYATGNLDDEEEEQAIEELKEGQDELTETIENLNEFIISTPCGQDLVPNNNNEETVEEPVKEEEPQPQENNQTLAPTVEEKPQCELVENNVTESEQNQTTTVIPPTT